MYFFASFILLCLFVKITIKRNNNQRDDAHEAFLERERLANTIRKKNIDHLDYITIPLDTFPTTILLDNEEVKDIITRVKTLSTKQILNLTGFSNTDLKLEYGVANINTLMDCDQNYTLLARTLQKWADILLKNNYEKEAKVIMEFAISTCTDISNTYFILANIYEENKEYDKITHLIKVADSLNSLSKDSIIKKLQEYGHCND